MSRIYSRRPTGQFRRATLENTFGLRTTPCPSCGAFNPTGVSEQRPTACEQCGASLVPASHQDPDDHADTLDLQGEREEFQDNQDE